MSKEGKLYIRSSMGTHHIAGEGVCYDDYSEEIGNRNYERYGAVRFPHDREDPKNLNGPVICIKEGKKKGGGGA